jgi:hypothetical protein
MSWRRLVLVALTACASHQPGVATLSPAGTHGDDGAGLLAQLSSTFVTGPADDEQPPPDEVDDSPTDLTRRFNPLDPASAFGGALYGGGLYGGLAYGGGLYGGLMASGSTSETMTWAGTAPPQPQGDTGEDNLPGAIEGVVTWQGAPPPRVTTACGAGDNPTLHVGSGHAIGGALVFIETADTWRNVPSYAKVATIGGVVVKHRCALLPAAQIVAPLPGVLTIHGDATAATLRATAPSGVTRAIDLQEGGQAKLDAIEGVVRIDSADGKLAPAWIVGISSPYYAITDDAGRFRIDELDAGTYDVSIWQAPVATVGANGAIAYGAPIVVHRKVTVGTTHAARLDVALK